MTAHCFALRDTPNRPFLSSEKKGVTPDKQTRTESQLSVTSCEADSADPTNLCWHSHLRKNGESHAKSEFSLRAAASSASAIRWCSLRAGNFVRGRHCARAELGFVFGRLGFFDLLD